MDRAMVITKVHAMVESTTSERGGWHHTTAPSCCLGVCCWVLAQAALRFSPTITRCHVFWILVAWAVA